MIAFVFTSCAWVMITWVMSGLAILTARREGNEPATWVRWCWAELRPFYLPANAAFAICGYLITPSTLGASAVEIALGLLCWRYLKDIDDDDRWKRRKAKLAAKVSRQGARLVVVPVAGGQR